MIIWFRKKIISDLKYGKSVRKSNEMMQLADDHSMALMSLERLKMTSKIDTQQCMLEISQRCPQYIRNKWKSNALKQKRDTGYYPKFVDFVSFIHEKAFGASDPVYGDLKGGPKKASNFHMSRGFSKSPASGLGSHPPAQSVTGNGPSALLSVHQNPSVYPSNPSRSQCVLCQQPHR